MLPRLSALGGIMFVVPLFALFIAVAYQLFVRAHVWLNMVYPTFALAATYTLLTVYRYLTEERERRRVKAAFQNYVSPAVIEKHYKRAVKPKEAHRYWSIMPSTPSDVAGKVVAMTVAS